MFQIPLWIVLLVFNLFQLVSDSSLIFYCSALPVSSDAAQPSTNRLSPLSWFFVFWSRKCCGPFSVAMVTRLWLRYMWRTEPAAPTLDQWFCQRQEATATLLVQLKSGAAILNRFVPLRLPYHHQITWGETRRTVSQTCSCFNMRLCQDEGGGGLSGKKQIQVLDDHHDNEIKALNSFPEIWK